MDDWASRRESPGFYHSPFTIYYSPIMNLLVLNCGSSTVKFQLIATDLDHIAQDADVHLAGGVVERIGGEAIIDFRARGVEPRRSTAPVRDVRAVVETIIRWVTSADSGIEEVKSVAD